VPEGVPGHKGVGALTTGLASRQLRAIRSLLLATLHGLARIGDDR
jgi:hypothetical protein